ncbi:MAG: hypothetical protein ACJASL_004379 [Paraglaciecola sp.]|jgi:hypothetical protein
MLPIRFRLNTSPKGFSLRGEYVVNITYKYKLQLVESFCLEGPNKLKSAATIND